MVRWRRATNPVLAAAILVGGCQPAEVEPTLTVQAARAELRDLITDVSAADAHQYRLTDDQGRSMGPLEIIPIPEVSTFAGVYFTLDDADSRFHLQLATSPDLMTWTWQVELAKQASQPSIEAAADGGYVVAWEQEPDPIHMVIAYFASWEELLSGESTKRFDVPITMPACGEGTPSIESASSELVEIGFHYHASCERDLQAGGWTDWTAWHSSQRRSLDKALIDLGVVGHIGDRDRIAFSGHDLLLIEGQLVVDDWGAWRLFLYDAETDAAEQLKLQTHAGSASVSNPTVDLIEINGKAAVLVTLYIFTEGSHGGEDGELIYYRYL